MQQPHVDHVLRPVAPAAPHPHLPVQDHGDEGDELEDLQRGEVPLPPQVLLHLGAQGGQEVVAVHDDVDAAVGLGAIKKLRKLMIKGHNMIFYSHIRVLKS